MLTTVIDNSCAHNRKLMHGWLSATCAPRAQIGMVIARHAEHNRPRITTLSRAICPMVPYVCCVTYVLCVALPCSFIARRAALWRTAPQWKQTHNNTARYACLAVLSLRPPVLLPFSCVWYDFLFFSILICSLYVMILYPESVYDQCIHTLLVHTQTTQTP